MIDSLTISIEGLEVFGRHGALPAETELGQRFVIDLEVSVDRLESTRTDALEDTIDYAALADAVAAIVAGPPVALLERLTSMIADRALQEPGAREVAVTVRKPHVAIAHTVGATSVRLVRSRVAG